MTPLSRPANLTEAQIEEFGREMDAIREEVLDSRGERDRNYIVGLIRFHRRLALGSRAILVASLFCLPLGGPFWTLLVLGVCMLTLAKILENMEIGHNVLHAQWDWMKDPAIQSNTWEWDLVCPSDQWMHSHNVVHHTWTNVLGKDRDIGYGMLRVTQNQRWHPFYLIQPLNAVLMSLLFEWFIALHDLELNRLLAGKKTLGQARPMLRQIGRKTWRQIVKDYLAWPLLGAVLATPFLPDGTSFLQVFLIGLAANAVANVLRSVWLFVIIFCGHFPAGVHHFRKESVENETRAQWYVRQLLGSCNIRGGSLFHVLSGNLSHQIEHHLFPDLPSNRYPEIAPRVQAMCARYGLPYNTGSLTRQFGTTVVTILRLSLPGPRPQTA
jgi:linoleoyl-CoA desaturase